VTSNGEIIFGSVDHNLCALDSFGKLKWRFTAGGQVFSPTVAADGTIYFQSADGKLYAIQDLAQNGGLSGQWPKYGAGMRNSARSAH
jgi:outer membrane protein assembly factor BamB